MAKALFLALAALVTVAVGCAAPTVASEDQGESSSAIKDNGPSTSRSNASSSPSTCGEATPNPSCEADFFVTKAFELAQEDIVGNGINVVFDAKDCIQGLAAIGVVTVATDGAAPIIVAALGFMKHIETINACANTALYLHKIGIADNVSCFVEPSRNSDAVNTCECTAKCNAGIDVPDADGERYETKKFEYGFISPGATVCNCTNDTKAVACGWTCNDWASSDESDCTCND